MWQPDPARGLVTPEAVVLEFDEAGAASRTLAILLDLSVQFGLLTSVLFVISLAFGQVEALEWIGIAALVTAVFVILFAYPVLCETFWAGRTVGKAALGLRVVTREGAPVRFRHAAIRGALALVELWLTFGAVAVVSVLVTRRHQRLGDLAAGTLVIRERSGAQSAAPVWFAVPWGAEAFASGLATEALRAQDYQQIRTFLVRAGGLTPQTRSALAWRLARDVAARLGATPPADMPPDVFLATVAAVHQRRVGMTLPPGPFTPSAAPPPGFAPPGFAPPRSAPPVPGPPGFGPPAPRAHPGPPAPPLPGPMAPPGGPAPSPPLPPSGPAGPARRDFTPPS